MIVKLTRSRFREIIGSIREHRCIRAVGSEEEAAWRDDDLLAVAGACMAELMRRREAQTSATTDEPLKQHARQAYARLTKRLQLAFNYTLTIASNLVNNVVDGPGQDEEKEYRVEIGYHLGRFIPEEGPAALPGGNGATPAHDCGPVEDGSKVTLRRMREPVGQ